MISNRKLQELNEPPTKKLRSGAYFDRLGKEMEEQPKIQNGIQFENRIVSIEILNDDALIKVFEFLPLHVWIRSERVCRR